MVDAPIRPVRICCGERHHGAQCPDGLVMCCLCFERVPVDRLAIEDGSRVDVCSTCAIAEQAEGTADPAEAET